MPTTQCRHRRWLPAARELLLALVPAVLLGVVLWHLLPAAGLSGTRKWNEGTVRYYDASGMPATVLTAAARWNASGASVRLEPVDSVRRADVVVEVDDERLIHSCGRDCLGYTSSIGRPSHGRTRVLLASDLGGSPRPLSIWVAAHELGHVLGLHHRDGNTCSLMSPHAFDNHCAPSLAATPPTLGQLACVPAPADVEDAARMYGGRPADDDPRCR